MALRRPGPRGVLSFIGLIVLVAGVFAAVRPQVVGLPFNHVLLSGTSMEPTLHGGDLVITQARSSYRVGDVLAYRIPQGEAGAGPLVIHRVIASGRRGYVLQGDNRETRDPWRPKDEDVLGAMVVHVPRAGFLLGFLRTPLGLAALAAAAALFFLLQGSGRERHAPTA